MRIGEEAEWLVSIPLLGTDPIAEPLKISHRCALIPTPVGGSHNVPTLEDSEREEQIEALFDDFVHSRSRREFDEASNLRETLAGTTLLLVLEGRETIALSRAETRARYLVALWCLLSPPETGVVWPESAEWQPGQNIRSSLIRKPYEPRVPRSERTSQSPGRQDVYGVYSVPERTILELGDQAVQLAEGGDRDAAALVSAARSLYLATMHLHRFERTERIMLVQQAMESIGNPKDWDHLVERVGTLDKVSALGYTAAEIVHARDLSRRLRNLGAHYAEDVFANLGLRNWRVEMYGAASVDSTEGHLAAVQFNAPIVSLLVSDTVRALVHHAAGVGWRSGWLAALKEGPSKDGSGPRS